MNEQNLIEKTAHEFNRKFGKLSDEVINQIIKAQPDKAYWDLEENRLYNPIDFWEDVRVFIKEIQK